MRRFGPLNPTAPALPAAGICLLALATVGLDYHGTNWAAVEIAAGVTALTIAAATLAPWSRLPADLLVVVPVACDVVIALLRHAQGGSGSGYASLAVLPALWVGLVLGRRAIAVITLCATAILAGPPFVVGPPLYPISGLRGGLLVSVVATVVAVGTHLLMAAQRRQTALADARARELDRLVETQHTIAASDYDATAVMNAVVSEALTLAEASSAVVELPDGDDLVHAAVAGSTARHVGLRLAQRSSISGRALTTRQTLVCSDSELDDRVDRDACRLLGVRSIVVVPLVHADRALGVLKVTSERTDAFSDGHVQVLILLANMIGTALVRAELIERLSDQAGRDELTGLPNRRAWHEQLALALARSRRSGAPLSVLVLDLDGLKHVNDSEGHAAGDLLLRTAGQRWSAALRDPDILGRLGGDEFGVILEGAAHEAAAGVIARLSRSLGLGRSASVGAATWDGAESAESLVARADAAMYLQKRSRVAAA